MLRNLRIRGTRQNASTDHLHQNVGPSRPWGEHRTAHPAHVTGSALQCRTTALERSCWPAQPGVPRSPRTHRSVVVSWPREAVTAGEIASEGRAQSHHDAPVNVGMFRGQPAFDVCNEP